MCCSFSELANGALNCPGARKYLPRDNEIIQPTLLLQEERGDGWTASFGGGEPQSRVWCSLLTQDLGGIRRNDGVPRSNQRQQLLASHGSLPQDGTWAKSIISGFIKQRDECREDRSPPGRLNAQLHPSTSLSPTASAQTWLPGDAEGEHLPNPPILHPVLQPHDAAPGLFSGHTAPTILPSFKSLPDELSTSCFCKALCRAASLPSCPPCTTEHLPPCPTPYQLLEDSEFQA